VSIITDQPRRGIGSRLAWFVLIWALSVLSVAVFALLLKWLVFTPSAHPL
jgi:hypothetical protein